MNFSLFYKKINLKKGFTHTPKIWVSGFTLTELVVVMAIAVILMTALVVQQSRWNNQLAVSTQAYELALTIRQAQIYSLGVREDVSGTGDKFNIGYGVHVAMTGNLSNRYILFADRNGNHRYDNSPDEQISYKLFTRGVKVAKICAQTLDPCPGNNGIRQYDVSFLRPQPNAYQSFKDNNGSNLVPQPFPPAFLRVQSADGSIEDVIKIGNNGQISMQ